MSAPLSLRICCIAAMAPALTEAASKPARVKLPVSPTGAEPDKILETKRLVIERSSGLRSSHIGILRPKDIHQLLNGDHLEGEVSLISNKDDKSKYLAIGGKLLDLRNLVLPQVKELVDSESELGKMNQPIRLFVNGSNTMTLDDGNSTGCEDDVVCSTKVSAGLKSSRLSEETVDANDEDSVNTEDMKAEIDKVPIATGGVSPVARPSSPDLAEDIDRRHHMMVRRAQRLSRRIRRLQIRQTRGHVSSQLADYVAYHHHNLEAMAHNIKSAQPSPSGPVPGTSSATTDFTPEMLSSEKIKSLSTAALVSLVRKLQSVQTPMALRQRTSQIEAPATLLRMSKTVRVESERTADKLIYNLKHMERALDSEATESSSGGESGEESLCEPMNRRIEPSSSITRCAPWQWARDRAQVAARWTWLQAQVSDLEYKIRTQSDIYRQLRATKGPVQLSESKCSPSVNNVMSTNCVNDKPAAFTAVSAGGQPVTVDNVSNGLSNSRRTVNLNGMVEEAETVSRCRPLAGYRPRRLFRTERLYQHSIKAARLSTLSCRCSSPVGTCAMCMGRFNHTLPLDADMARNEKLALLDSSYHHVLSFPEDVPLTLIMEPMVRSAPGLQKASPRYLSRTSNNDKTNKYRKKYQRSGTSKSKKLKKTAASLLSMKYKSRFNDRAQSPKQNKRRDAASRGLSRAEMRKRKKLKMAMKRRAVSTSRQNSAQTSPRDSPLLGGQKKKKLESNYDIDNIVIPYGSAAPTRVEKLEYKEIITPKWRLNPIDSVSSSEMNYTVVQAVEEEKEEEEEEEIEDMSDESYAARHFMCEVREKQRYCNFITTSRRKNGSTRTESGANTPDLFPDPEPHTPHTPQTPPVTPSLLDRRRAGSVSCVRSRAQSICESRTTTPDPEDCRDPRPPVQYWPARRFPLSQQELLTMVKESECVESKVRVRRKSVRIDGAGAGAPGGSGDYVYPVQMETDTVSCSVEMSTPHTHLSDTSEDEQLPVNDLDPDWDALITH